MSTNEPLNVDESNWIQLNRNVEMTKMNFSQSSFQLFPLTGFIKIIKFNYEIFVNIGTSNGKLFKFYSFFSVRRKRKKIISFFLCSFTFTQLFSLFSFFAFLHFNCNFFLFPVHHQLSLRSNSYCVWMIKLTKHCMKRFSCLE